MKAFVQILTLCCAALLLGAGTVSAQTVIIDYETPATSNLFNYFGNNALSDQPIQIVANPNATGANVSANVGQFVKTANSMTWAGAYSVGTLAAPVNLSTGGQVCVKVHFSSPGSVSLKLEGSATGPNWITTQPVSTAGEWVEVCFDASNLSIEAPFTAATGHTYSVVVLFFDFGTAFPTEKTYYFDDVKVSGGASGNADVTFSVDMNSYAGTVGTVYASGTFNEWSGEAFPLSDDDMDGVWTGTYAVPAGLHEYKFTMDNWSAQEMFNGFETCVVSANGFTNRSLTVSGDATLPTVCWNSCYACGQAVNITFNLGTNHIDVAESGVFIAGGGNFGIPGDFPMQDPDNDGVYSITIERPLGFASFYAFTNGNCPDYSCKENLAGLACGDPNNFNDRFLPAVMQDTVLNTCFGLCTDNTDCGEPPVSTDVTFILNMNEYEGDFTTPYVAGTFNNWSDLGNPMTDANNDGIWETTVTGILGDTIEYKFQLDAWSVQEQFEGGEACTMSDPSGQFVNRFAALEGGVLQLDNVCWNSCEACTNSAVENLVGEAAFFSMAPVPAAGSVTLFFEQPSAQQRQILLFDLAGRQLFGAEVEGYAVRFEMPLHGLANGLYLVQVREGDRRALRQLSVLR